MHMDIHPRLIAHLLIGIALVMTTTALCLPWVECPACAGPGVPPAPTILDRSLDRLREFQSSLRSTTVVQDEDNDVYAEVRTLSFTPIRWVPICPRCRGKGRLSLLELSGRLGR